MYLTILNFTQQHKSLGFINFNNIIKSINSDIGNNFILEGLNNTVYYTTTKICKYSWTNHDYWYTLTLS